MSVASWTGESFTSKAIAFVDDAKPNAVRTQAQAGKGAEFAARKNYTFITATGPGELSFGPATAVGTFTSPVNQGDVLRGSFFTQSFIAYLKQLSGDVPQAFDAAQAFSTTLPSIDPKGTNMQPRKFSKALAMALVMMSMTAQAEEPAFAAKSLFFGEDGDVKAVTTGKASATEAVALAPVKSEGKAVAIATMPRRIRKICPLVRLISCA